MNTLQLPEELRRQLGGDQFRDPGRRYTAHDLVLSFIVHRGDDGATANDLLVYLWAQTGKVTSRAYLYGILSKLRLRGHISTRNSHVPSLASNYSTALGRLEARPYKEIRKP